MLSAHQIAFPIIGTDENVAQEIVVEDKDVAAAAAAATTAANNLILVNSARMAELEQIEKNLPELIAAAIKENKIAKLKKLHEKDKLNPSAVNARVKRYNEKHKDKIAEKRNAKKIDKLITEGKSEAEINHIVTKFKVLAPVKDAPTASTNARTQVVSISTFKELIVHF